VTTFSARTDRHLVRANGRSRRHVLLTLTAPRARRRATKRPAVNVAFVLDRSGSMSGSAIGLAKCAVERALQGLTPSDRFSIVAYDDQMRTWWTP
jgi:Ca-activated chloride channel family protein